VRELRNQTGLASLIIMPFAGHSEPKGADQNRTGVRLLSAIVRGMGLENVL
jgi:hypothetical protein